MTAKTGVRRLHGAVHLDQISVSFEKNAKSSKTRVLLNSINMDIVELFPQSSCTINFEKFI